MKILKLITFILVILCCNSCSKDEEEFNVIDGGQIVEVPQSGGNYLLKSSQYSQWWLVNISMKVGDGDITNLYDDNDTHSAQVKKDGKHVRGDYYDFYQDVHTNTEVICRLGANPSDEERTFDLTLEAWDYFETVTLHQKGKK